MLGKLLLVALAAAAFAQHHKHDPCRTCEFLLDMAEHHFHRNITDETALQAQLRVECQNLGRFEGQNATVACLALVNHQPSMDKIYADVVAGDRNRQTCYDIGECASPTFPPHSTRAPENAPEVLPKQHDPCRTCEFILGMAEHHFHNNVTDKTALQNELLKECQRLSHFEGKDAAQACTDLVNAKIDIIFSDIQKGDKNVQTCYDLGECASNTDPTHHPRHTTTAAPAAIEVLPKQHDPCRTCEFVLGRAEHHFHNNVTDKTALKSQLWKECQELSHFEGKDAAKACTDLVNNKIDLIYSDIQKGDKNVQTCYDLGECASNTDPTHHPRHTTTAAPAADEILARKPDPCRTCLLVLGMAERHFHEHVTDEAALKEALLKECDMLVVFEGKDAAQACTALVNAKIDVIFADIQKGDKNVQTCHDLGECASATVPSSRAQHVA